MTTTFRLAEPQDAQQILDIYAPNVLHTVISFELQPPSVEEMLQRITSTLTRYPWLVCEQDKKILGYVYASSHRTRAAYQWAVDVSAYIHPQARRMGIGRALYQSLISILRLQGYFQAFAGIALPNPGSVGLHEAMGFQPIGVYRSVGYKLGAWHDVGWWQLTLQALVSPPNPPISLPQMMQTPQWQAAFSSGLSFLKI
jgi:L-amino acid N-acyltransferase YncA